MFLYFDIPLWARTPYSFFCVSLSLFLPLYSSHSLLFQPLEFFIFVDLSTHQIILPFSNHFCFLSLPLSHLLFLFFYHFILIFAISLSLSLPFLTHSLSLSFTLKLCPLFCRLSQMEKKLRLSRINRPRRA